jgi:hypothetical protein
VHPLDESQGMHSQVSVTNVQLMSLVTPLDAQYGGNNSIDAAGETLLTRIEHFPLIRMST